MIQTERLCLRRWQPEDRAPFAALNADPLVMEYFVKTLSREESNAVVDRHMAHWEARGWGAFAVEYQGRCVGYIGVTVPAYELPFSPCVEIGWRLSREVWNQGIATEGARAVLRHSFEVLALPEVVSFTAEVNVRSQRVMEKLGMRRDPADDFDHPKVASGHPLLRHVLYRIRPSDMGIS